MSTTVFGIRWYFKTSFKVGRSDCVTVGCIIMSKVKQNVNYTFSATYLYEERFWNSDTIRPRQNNKTDNCSLFRNVLMFCFFRLCHQVHGFFKGMSLPLTTVTLTSSVSFGTYRNCLQCLGQMRRGGSGPNTKLEVFLSGMAGGIAQVTHATLQTG